MRAFHLLATALAVSALLCVPPAAAQTSTRHRPAKIEARVVDPAGRPVSDVRVTLLSNVYSRLETEITPGSGLARFTVPHGNYYLDVEPIGLAFENQRQRVEIPSNPAGAAEIFRFDIVLRPSRPAGAPVQGPGGVRFYQKVPEAARLEYERALRQLQTKPEEAYAGLRKALQLFPDYYDAMETLGSEYVKAGYLDYAVPLLVRGLEVNPNGGGCHYALGVACYNTSRFADAVQSFTRAISLGANAVNATLYLGLSHAKAGDDAKAEVQLKKAYEMGAKRVPELHLALASLYSNGKRYREAADELNRLLRESPKLKDRDKIRQLIETLRRKAG